MWSRWTITFESHTIFFFLFDLVSRVSRVNKVGKVVKVVKVNKVTGWATSNKVIPNVWADLNLKMKSQGDQCDLGELSLSKVIQYFFLIWLSEQGEKGEHGGQGGQGEKSARVNN